MMDRIVLASGNAGKLRELSRALLPLGVELLPLSDFTSTQAEETGLSYVENALIKARHAADASGLPALADDSGLSVDALGGAPGVYSARYAGPEADNAANRAKLLQALAEQPQRTAAFHCVLALVRSAQDPLPRIAQGHWAGEILRAERGDGGFGYDPVFFDPELGLSAAEMDPETKQARSHRGHAVRQLLDQLRRA